MNLGHHHLKIPPTMKLLTSKCGIWYVILIQQRQRLIDWELECKILGGMHIGKQLDCTTSIARTQNVGIQCIHSSQHTTFNRFQHFANHQKCGSITMCGVECIITASNHPTEPIVYYSSSLNLILGLAMIVELKTIHISSEHNTTVICSNV
jgi:hypothetical protein